MNPEGADLRLHRLAPSRVRLVAASLFVVITALTMATQDMGYTRDESFYFHYAESYQSWFVGTERADDRASRRDVFGRDAVVRTWSGNFEHPPAMKALFGFAWRALSRKDRDVDALRETDGALVARLQASPATGFAEGAAIRLLAPLAPGQDPTDPSRELARGEVVEREGDRIAISLGSGEHPRTSAILERCRSASLGPGGALMPCQVREDRTFDILDEASGMRLFGAISAGLAFAFTFMLGELFFGWLVGLLAAAFFLFVPEHFFHGHLTAFDMPVVAAQLFVLYAFWRSLDDRRWALAAGVGWGFALLVKHNAMFIPVALVLWWLWTGRDRISLRLRGVGRGLSLPRMPLAFLLMLAVGLPMLFVFWPRLWYDPLRAVAEYFQFHLAHEHYMQYWFGAPLQVPPFPVSYPFVKTALTYPEVFLWFIAVGGYLMAPIHRAGAFLERWREVTHKERVVVFLLLNGLIPIAVIALPSTPIFGGIKHWMTGTPFLAIIAAWGAISLCRALRFPRPAELAVVGLLILHPVAASLAHARVGTGYHNSLIAGGLPGAADKRLMRHFWGYSTHPVLPWLNAWAPKNARVFWQNTTRGSYEMYQRMGLLRHDIRYHHGPAGADIALIDAMQPFFELEQQTRKALGRPAPQQVVVHAGVPFLHVYAREGAVGPGAFDPAEWRAVWR